MGVATNCVKYIMFFLNLIFVVAGLALMIAGIVARVSLKNAGGIEGGEMKFFQTALLAVIIIGALIAVISFFGCCGAIKEDVCMLNTFGVMLLIFFLTQIALGTYIYIKIKNDPQNYQDELGNWIQSHIDEYGNDAAITQFVDGIQSDWKCCGKNGPEDWNLPKKPASCCPSEKPCSNSEAYQDGCVNKFKERIAPLVIAAGIVLIVIAVLELLGGIFGICLAHSISNNRKYYT